ncbi:MAG: BON domain-containing protein [Kofleriaceae bacterium]
MAEISKSTDAGRVQRSVQKPDAQLQQDVLNELKWDTRVEPNEVGVEVDSGIVTLTGTVSSWAKKMAAQEAAHRVAGVLDVANDLIVQIGISPERSDTDIAAAVRHALQWDVFVPDEDIQSSVSHGFVTLTGEVATATQREDAARAVRNLAGVCAVENRITLRQHEVTPDELRAAIHNALERHAERDSERIRIDVEGGRVTLHGDVHTWRDRQAIVGAVTGTRGVDSVIDRLHVG